MVGEKLITAKTIKRCFAFYGCTQNFGRPRRAGRSVTYNHAKLVHMMAWWTFIPNFSTFKLTARWQKHQVELILLPCNYTFVYLRNNHVVIHIACFEHFYWCYVCLKCLHIVWMFRSVWSDFEDGCIWRSECAWLGIFALLSFSLVE